MIREAFRIHKKPLGELVHETMSHLGKYYSRMELAVEKLKKRNDELFNICKFYLKKGYSKRATIYANEIAETRKILSSLEHTMLALERAILRVETIKEVSPTFEELKGVFGDVKNALGILTNVMPSITPEMDKLSNAVNEILETTTLDITPPEPLIFEEPQTEEILKEVAGIVEKEVEKRIPEPPVETEPLIPKPVKQMVALSTSGSEVYTSGEDSPILTESVTTSLPEELFVDYLERNNGEVNVTRCAKELNMPPAKVFEILDALSRKGKIKIEQ